MNNKSLISKLKDKLAQTDLSRVKCLIGFDGFVDEVVHVVKKRIDADTYLREETLKGYGERIAKTSGLSSNVEIVTVSKKIGGNGPIMTNALCGLGAAVSYIGAVGYPEINPVFSELEQKCTEIISISEPAQTDAVEFSDGKIIRSKISALNDVNYNSLAARAGEQKTASVMQASDLVGFVNWSLLNHASALYSKILQNIVPLIEETADGKKFFFDLADPYSRTREDLFEILGVIGRYNSHFGVVLGLNLSEAIQVCNLYGKTYSTSDYELKDLCKSILSCVGVSQVVIHPTDQACCMTSEGEYFHASGPYCKNPSLTTGAGDNFNAGYMLGTAAGFGPGECLLLGMAVSGYYVRNAKSASKGELSAFLDMWSKDKL